MVRPHYFDKVISVCVSILTHTNKLIFAHVQWLFLCAGIDSTVCSFLESYKKKKIITLSIYAVVVHESNVDMACALIITLYIIGIISHMCMGPLHIRIYYYLACIRFYWNCCLMTKCSSGGEGEVAMRFYRHSVCIDNRNFDKKWINTTLISCYISSFVARWFIYT